jgi:hypothetical protein
MMALNVMQGEVSPAEFKRWSRATAAAMAALQDHLLQPLSEEHPALVPETLGGPKVDWNRVEALINSARKPPARSARRPRR